MAKSLTARIEERGMKTISSFAFSEYSVGVGSSSLARQNRTLTERKADIAFAYLYIEPFRAAVDFIANLAGQIPVDVVRYDYEDGRYIEDVIASSSDPIDSRHRLVAIIREHEQRENINLIESIMYEVLLYDEVAIEFMRPMDAMLREVSRSMRRANGLRVLRGAALTVNGRNGIIQNYTYSGDDTQAILQPEDVAYNKGYHPLNEYRGAAKALSILDEMNNQNEMRRFLARTLRKADRPDVYAAPLEKFSNDRVALAMREGLERYKNDPDATVYVGNMPLNFSAIPTPDMNNQLEVDTLTRKAIYRAFGVPLVLVGDNSNTPYKDADNVLTNFVQMQLKPLLARVYSFLNQQVIPAFGVDDALLLRPDLSDYDVLTDDQQNRIQVANADFDGGRITLGQWAEATGNVITDELAEWRKIEGVLIPPDGLDQVWRAKYMIGFGVAAGDGGDSRGTAVINDGSVTVNDDGTLVDRFGTAIPNQEVFGYHIDAGIVDINEARAQIGLPPIQSNEGNDVAKLRNQLQTAQDAIQLGISREDALELVGLTADQFRDGLSGADGDIKSPIAALPSSVKYTPPDNVRYPDLYEQAYNAARRKYDVFPSAYANGFLVQDYKRRVREKHGSSAKPYKLDAIGNEDIIGGVHDRKDLDQWFEEEWVDISKPKDGGGYEPCGAREGEGASPKCLPKSRAARLSEDERQRLIRRKRDGGGRGDNASSDPAPRKAIPSGVAMNNVTHNGVTVQASRIMPSDRDDKKYMVYVRRGDDERKVHFGQPSEQMERDNDEARANFNSRHNCADKTDPFSAGFWACYAWKPDAPIPGSKAITLDDIRVVADKYKISLKAALDYFEEFQRVPV